MPKISKPTVRMKKFVANYLNGGMTNADAVIRAGYKPKDVHNASAIAYDLLQKPMVQAEIQRVLTASGLSMEDIAVSLNKIVQAGVNRADQTATADSALRGLDMAARMMSLYPSESKTVENKTLNITLNSMSLEDLKKKLDELNSETTKYLTATPLQDSNSS